MVELDKDLVPILQHKFADRSNFRLHQGDALKFDFNQLGVPPRSLKVVGNLPYNISTPLIFHLLSHAADPRHAFHAAEGSGRAHGRRPWRR